MKTKDNSKSLESYRIFPFIAWALIIGFGVFVYNIALTLQDVANDLQRQTEYIEQQINQNPEVFLKNDLDSRNNEPVVAQ